LAIRQRLKRYNNVTCRLSINQKGNRDPSVLQKNTASYFTVYATNTMREKWTKINNEDGELPAKPRNYSENAKTALTCESSQ